MLEPSECHLLGGGAIPSFNCCAGQCLHELHGELRLPLRGQGGVVFQSRVCSLGRALQLIDHEFLHLDDFGRLQLFAFSVLHGNNLRRFGRPGVRAHSKHHCLHCQGALDSGLLPGLKHLFVLAVFVEAEVHLCGTQVREFPAIASAYCGLREALEAPIGLYDAARLGTVVLVQFFREGLRVLRAGSHMPQDSHKLGLFHSRLSGPDEVLHHVRELLCATSELPIFLQSFFVHYHSLLHILTSHHHLVLHCDGDKQLSRRFASLAGEGPPGLLGQLQELLQDLLHLDDHELVDVYDFVHGDTLSSLRVSLASRMEQLVGTLHDLVVILVLHQYTMEGRLTEAEIL
mmetsp:Transcript_2078/g.4710  ORF Transcript_2078/g.4710 Transcript_2078/m.4710 type:complete len:345 (+) Transcript_2078:242-1276(+)